MKALLVLALGLGAPAALGRALATVDGQTIQAEALRHAASSLGTRGDMMLANPTLRRQLLDHLIETRILAKAGTAAGIEKTAEYQSLLAEAKAQLLATAFANQVIAEHSGDAAVRSYFDKDPVRFSAKEVHALHVLVKDEAEAKQVLAEATAKGADFSQVAKRHSKGPSGPQGGDLGFFRRGRMLPAFDLAAFSTPKGQIYPQPVKTEFGWHVIKVVDVRGNDDVRFDDVKDRVKEVLSQQIRDELLQQLKAKAKVTVDEEAVRTMPYTH